MAKFRSSSLYLESGEKVIFSTDESVQMWWDGAQLVATTVISGVDPTQSYHLTTKQYVDDTINTLSGIIGDHGNLMGLEDDDHTQYVPTDGTRGFTSTVSGIYPTQDYHLATKDYVDDEIGALSSGIVLDHGGLTGLADDDHQQYTLADGTRGFTGTVSGITPTEDAHLATKGYVDLAAQGLDWQESVINFYPVASGITTIGNRYIASETGGGWTEDYIYEYNGVDWTEIIPDEGTAVWVEEADGMYVFNGTDWVQFGSTITHNVLNGLQGGSTGEYYHLTSAQQSGLTGGTDTTLHTHDDRYFTETEITTISGDIIAQIPSLTGYATETWVSDNYIDNSEMTTISGDIVAQIPTDYISESEMTTISGDIVSQIVTDHGGLTGLLDDDHPQYVLVDGSRGFTATVSGVTPVNDYDLATKGYVDDGGVDRKGRQSISNDSSVVTVNFSDIGSTNYTISATLENTSDSPPSIYAYIISAKTSSSFTVTLMGDTDSANYILNWMVIED